MADSRASPYVGRLIGNYRLKELIGEGGMGEVFLAEREHEFRKLVAVKLIRPGMASLEVIRRFVIERQTLAALNHPQIVRLIDGGSTEEGLPYLVVDYVNGTVIDQYCDSHQLNIAARLQLFLQVCDAVHHAHQSLIVHCDLKPSNILVTSEGVPMLLDFGIAKLLDPGSLGVSAQAAQTRQRAYTPDYASPEQVRGEPVTTATDIYALGVVLYELLTGHSPYGATASKSLADWIQAICERDAEPPSIVIRRVTQVTTEEVTTVVTPEGVSASREGDPQALHRRLRGDLDAIVLKALRKDPRDRYGSVDQLAEDLRRHLSGRPVLARKSTAPYVMRKFLQRHKASVAAAALIVLAMSAGLVSTFWQARVAARRFDDVRHLARTFLFDVHDSIQYLPGSTAARSLIARTGAEYLDRLARGSRGDVSLQMELAEGYLKIGDVEGNPFGANLGNTSNAVDNYRKALSIAESVTSRDPKNTPALKVLARTHLELASVLPFGGKVTEGLEHAVRALGIYKRISTAEPDNLEARLDVTHAYELQGDLLGGAQGINLARYKDAVDSYQEGLRLLPDLPPGSPLLARGTRARAVLLAKLGDMETKTGNVQAAVPKYEDALRTAERLSAADPNNTRARDLISAMLNKLGSSQTSLGYNQAALATYQRAIEINETSLKGDPNNDRARTGLLIARKNLGDLYYYNLHNMPLALVCYRRVAELLEIQSAADPQNLVWRRNLAEDLTYVASCLVAAHHPDEARREAQRGLTIAKELADQPNATQDAIYQYAWLAITIEPADLRHPAAVLPYAIKAVEMGGSADPFSLHVLAQAYAGTGDYANAVKTEEKAMALFPPLEPGKPVSGTRATVANFLEECRKELKKRGGTG